MDYTLSILILLPLLGAIFIGLFVKNEAKEADNAKKTALLVTIATFLFSLSLLSGFNFSDIKYQYVELIPLTSDGKISYYLGIDSISLLFILLTTFLMPVCIVAGFRSINNRVKEYMIYFLILESIILAIFCALDILLFYIFFEAVLIPMFLIIGIWGGENRFYASFKFFLYTLAGSVLLLVAIIYLFLYAGTTSIPFITEYAPTLSLDIQKWLWLAMFASFAVKVPMWPLHTWLPDAHVQAPTAGSVILAGVLLKLGGYGFIRFSLPMLPAASEYFADFVLILSLVAIIYTSLIALMQKDMKKLIAYSSVAHMGYVTLGLFSLNEQGIEGAIFVMISHGLISGALFLCVGILYDRMHTKEIAKYGGVTKIMPKFAFLFMIFTFASIGLPGTSGFVGEVLTMAGAYKVNTLFAAISATGVILGAAYMLWLFARVMFGKVASAEIEKMKDVNYIEFWALLPIGFLVILFGVYPSLITDIANAKVLNLVTLFNK